MKGMKDLKENTCPAGEDSHGHFVRDVEARELLFFQVPVIKLPSRRDALADHVGNK